MSSTPQTQAILDRANAVLIGNYARSPIVMVRGEGAELWDSDDNHYIDLFAGFGGCILGHAHPALIAAATDQAQRLWHVGNTYHTRPQIELAERLNRTAFTGQAFFCHSGAEANEAACKLARLFGQAANPHRWKIITLDKSFHGRTLAMISATGNPAVRAGFAPDVPGFIHVPPGDLAALEAAVDAETAAIMIEPIQGEGGINLHPPGYVEQVRKLCDERGILLIFDEVWTGCGRTGRWFGYQHFGGGGSGGASGAAAGLSSITPDIMTLGKAIGCGLPVGVMFARPHIAKALVPGKHGCTLGGNPICMSVARTLFDVIERENLLEHAAAMGEQTMTRLRREPSLAGRVAEVRGRGLFIGIELKQPPTKLLETALANGVIINLTAQKVVRLAPPINIDQDLLESGIERVIKTITVS
jgi:predicted acetylornithine/succinylornithine family transaminase